MESGRNCKPWKVKFVVRSNGNLENNETLSDVVYEPNQKAYKSIINIILSTTFQITLQLTIFDNCVK